MACQVRDALYYAAHRVERSVYEALRRANPERQAAVLASYRRWRQRNPEKAREYARQWWQSHPEKRGEYRAKAKREAQRETV